MIMNYHFSVLLYFLFICYSHSVPVDQLQDEGDIYPENLRDCFIVIPSPCKLPIPAAIVKEKLANSLTAYEKAELNSVENVYYVPLSLHRTDRILAASIDKQSQKIPRLMSGDHINFRYKILGKLNSGSFGIVAKALDIANNAKPVAIKINSLHVDPAISQMEYENLMALKDGKGMDSDSHVLQLLDSFTYRKWTAWVFPLYDEDWISIIDTQMKKREIVSMDMVKYFTEDVLKGLKYMKSKRIVHFDIKPDNVLYKLTSPQQHPDSVIADLGLSKPHDKAGGISAGTLSYASPEVILSSPENSYPLDMWSLGASIFLIVTHIELIQKVKGVNLLEVMALRVPTIKDGSQFQKYKDAAQQSRFRQHILSFLDDLNRVKHKYIQNLSGGQSIEEQEKNRESFNLMVDFVRKCLQWDTKDRMTVEEALEHPFLRN